MEKIIIFPPIPVVHVPITLFNSNKQAIDSKYILECNWFIDDEIVQSFNDNVDHHIGTQLKRTSSTSLLSLVTSIDQPKTLTYIPTLKDANKTLKVTCKFKSKILNLIPDTSIFQYEHKVLSSKSNSQREIYYLDNSLNHPNNNTINNNNFSSSKSNLGASLQNYRVIQYNILADGYVSKFIFPYCEPYALFYQYYRKYLIGKQILQYNPDIIGLQEVEDSYVDLFKEMEECGYVRSPPFSNCTGLPITPGAAQEGCVIFYRSSRFQVISHLLIRYQTINAQTCSVPNSILTLEQYQLLLQEPIFKPILEKVMPFTDHHTKHVLLLLQDKQTQRIFVAASIHNYWGSISKMEFNYQFQCLQIVILSMILENFLRSNQLPLDTGVVLCGDFNAGPESESYKFLSKGFFSDTAKITIPFQSPFIFKSIYSQLPYGEPRFTTYTKSFQGNIDQIFINNSFQTHSILDISDRSLYNEFGYLPSIVLGSDHILLLSDIELKK
ncbi:endonuclease/exonuclease/phosphatase domain-containing protein [Tieghemostelium lacteum]|uniref:Endonuclease/exonuclease/phosphatase domain-containing protein n=1 Tax=Tieghemostelium lacteum TaxID=361077 RepID=A0A152A5B5_TIELA|nr:endonuclease/exonuclease/phosphatase domain-containing protein [Tieghemostelium lacteum]|eukprot:KYR01265.1 endonuclease/exonuclease/phosphatase domain-containing protein [Tieghemostelium lacteum]